jgi:hypothetical protein
MRQRVLKFVGMLALVAFIAVNALVVMAVSATRVPMMSGLGQLVFFAVAGLVWVLPAGLIIWWMQRPDRGPGGA